MLTSILISSYAAITVGVFLLPSFLPKNHFLADRSFEGRAFCSAFWPLIVAVLPLIGLKILAKVIADWTDRRSERKVQALKQFADLQDKQLKLLNKIDNDAKDLIVFLKEPFIEETDYRHAHCQSCGQVKK